VEPESAALRRALFVSIRRHDVVAKKLWPINKAILIDLAIDHNHAET
jgi:hypothetical protein